GMVSERLRWVGRSWSHIGGCPVWRWVVLGCGWCRVGGPGDSGPVGWVEGVRVCGGCLPCGVAGPRARGVVVRLFGWWWWCGWTVVPVVSAGTPLEVDAERWDPFGEAVGCDADLPVGVVCGIVVRGADQQQIGQARGTTISPMLRMMHVTPFRRNITRRESAATVTKDHRAAQRSGNGTGRPANIQRLPIPTQHHRNDLRIARHPPDSTGRQMLPRVKQARASLLGQLLVRDGHHHGRPFPTLLGQIPDPQG